jgi:acyl carrier protein
MVIQDFIEKIETEFEDIKPGVLKPESRFADVLDWNSVNALTVIALVDCEYDVILTADDFFKSETVLDIYNIIQEKLHK